MSQAPTAPSTKYPWTKIFTAFRVALDMKKLALAATGIFFAWVGWAILAWIFYGMREMPEWEGKAFAPSDTATAAEKDALWDYFMAKRASWNVIHELAGRPEDLKNVHAADVAHSLAEYEMLSKWGPGRSVADVTVLAGVEAAKGDDNTKKVAAVALETYRLYLVQPRIKPAGLLRVSPWSEDRGGNPYLIVADAIKTRGESVFGGGRFLTWFMTDEARVVLEPLFKFLTPVVYLFDQRAGGWDRLYLILIIVWTLFIWGFFGGAICRIAAVQVARNERITLREALLFTKERTWSYLAAPVLPLALVAVLTVLLMIFGWVEWIPYFVGDVIAGVLWPIVLVFGFIMAIVLVGLAGWPLMIATISTEGTDSFDALSRSYSYVYQAPWRYLWYGVVSVAYGAVLVFFVGFMASLLVFLGKWGVSSAMGPSNPNPVKDREPSYLFQYAPTSFGWRSLLISSNARFVEEKIVTEYDGRTIKRLEFTKEYQDALQPWEKTGAFLVSIWIYVLFLLVIGFGYSYFFSASTIIYFLMRRHVDDTEMDEVHLEDEEMTDPFMTPPPSSPVAAPSTSKPGTMSLNVVEAPPSPPPASVAATPYTTPDRTPAPSEVGNTTPPEKSSPGGMA